MRAAFDAHAHKVLATLQADGSPRISGIEMGFVAGVPPGEVGFELFRVDLVQVVLVALNEVRTALVISSWRPGRGLRRTQR